MPSYLDFNSTKKFRDVILAKTLQVPNGPQTFTQSSYSVQNLSDSSNVDPGSVDTNRKEDLLKIQTSNTFKPLEYFVKDTINTLPRRANLSLYYTDTPYFKSEKHNLIGIMSTDKYENESELFKFAASYIRDKNQKGPVYARIEQNLLKATVGKVRLIDALEGNTATAANIITGKEPLVESNYQITVAKTIPGKGIDFLQTVAGIVTPWSEIPGDYLTNPQNPINVRPVPNNEFTKILQDTTGALGSLLGIQRRPALSRKPSDLLIDYMGSGQKQTLFDLLSYSRYAPNYTTTARSQQSSKIFNFVSQIGQSVKSLLGNEAPRGQAYIGDDRSQDVRYATMDFNDRQVRGSYYLSLMFDPVQTELLHKDRNFGEGGQVSGKLTWTSRNSRNKLGENNQQYNDQRSQLEQSLSTKYGFRDDSLMGYTQNILDSMPKDGGEARSHVANAIDQTSRIFREGDVFMSRGSAVQYVDKFGQESGVEYCRVWTKDRPYLTYSDSMKKGGNIRKYEGSVMSDPWNLNYGPMSNGKKGFEGSSNIVGGYKYGADADGKSFYAKKYMFSIENLAWKSSTRPGFTVLDLPYCERGPNGGRVMWFPPYDLKVSESNSARWESNTFLGRPEPIYTYQNTERSGQISFKVVVDHPSVLNLLVREHFNGMSDEAADNYINAFFAGCEELDFYDLIRRYTTLDKSDVDMIKEYLNKGGDTEVIKKYKTVLEQPTTDNPSPTPQTPGTPKTTSFNLDVVLNFDNDIPQPKESTETSDDYTSLYTKYIGNQIDYATRLDGSLTNLLGYSSSDTKAKKDRKNIFGTENPSGNAVTLATDQVSKLNDYFSKLEKEFTTYTAKTDTLKIDISGKTVQNITIDISSSTSSIAKVDYNKKLSLRRSYSLIKDFFKRITKDGVTPPDIKWKKVSEIGTGSNIDFENEYNLKDFGWTENTGKIVVKTKNYGETYSGSTSNSGDSDCINRDFVKENDLNIVAPISFYCRKATMSFKYDKTEQPVKPNNPEPPKTTPAISKIVEEEVKVTKTPKKPPVDVMKRIIMKTLSECYYFKKLEEDSPVSFKSLKEKLRYFHPAFHSTTPEGLNARLTFLQQCIRPGDTIPVKGISDSSDLPARNTTFGPPPVCVLRVGDFYHSKIVIRDVNISYDEGVWDMNPEGIGVQPMIATVQLSVSFIGGQGLEKPVELLQNALSSNFYANTEMYDERSVSSLDKENKEKYDTFSKKFLEELLLANNVVPDTTKDEPANEITQEKYIGTLSNNELSYTTLIGDIYTKIENYFGMYPSTYNILLKQYGPKIIPMLFSPTYRKTKTYDVYTTTTSSPGTTMDLFGLYEKGKELPILVRGLKTAMVTTLESSNPTVIFGFDKELTTPKVSKSDEYLKPYLKTLIETKLDELVDKKILTEFEVTRDSIISSVDKLNYIVKYGKDFKVKGEKGTEATLSGFTYDKIYDEYKDTISYVKDNTSLFYSDLDTTINFYSPVISTDTLSEILSVLIKDEKNNIMKLYEADTIIFDEKIRKNLSKRLDNFIVIPKDKKFKFKKFVKRKNDKEVKFSISNQTEVTSGNALTEAKKLFSSKLPVSEKLNYYKKWVEIILIGISFL